MIDTEGEAWRKTRIVAAILPSVAEEACFALKGGTAINFFVVDLLRISVDIDLTYLPAESRETALAGIDAGLRRIARRLSSQYDVAFGRTSAGGRADTLQIRGGEDEVKIEVNPVLRQTLLPVRTMAVLPRVEATLGYSRMQVLSHEELYAGKLAAALDRQHPRDVFDAKVLLETQGLSDALIRAFIAYVAGHKGVMAHIVAPRFGDPRKFRNLYNAQLLGMTQEDVTMEVLMETWETLVREIRARIGEKERRFLLSLKRGEPEWDLLELPGASEWPAIRWKLHNLAKMTPKSRQQAIEKLERALEQTGVNTNATQQIVNKAWSFAHVLRDDGLSYMAYTEQITFLLFLKMDDEQTKLPGKPPSVIPKGKKGERYDWAALLAKDGEALETQYRATLEHLSRQPGMLGEIFKKARPDIQNPATLKRLIVDLIEPESWMSLEADVKGDIYEGLLAKSAAESPKGAGQYFTPRELIKALVDVMQPTPEDAVCDPACGTGGFLLAAHAYVSRRYGRKLDPDQKKHLRTAFVHGTELVPATARLAIMNLLLHGVDADPCPVVSGVDSLAADPGDRYSMVLTNPPFGKKSSISIVNEEGDLEKEETAYERQDFWTTTKNKQLNFLQHIKTLLKVNGRCAVVVPDNVLFEGGAGETVRRQLLKQFDVHTLLRLPTGIFYAQGVKANVLFFDAKPAQEAHWTSRLWVYDLRTNMHFTLKTNPLKRTDLNEFVACFNPANRHERKDGAVDGRSRSFGYDELLKRDKLNLDIFWLKDKSLEDSENLPEPDVLAQEIADDLQTALEQFAAIAAELKR